jgi:hypothetical protein
MVTWEELRSDKALVCHKEHRTGDGVGTVWSVLLSDGCLLDCGSGPKAQRRAEVLASIINEGGPDRLSHEALS